MAVELIQKCIGENARVAQNQGEYAKRYDALVGRLKQRRHGWKRCSAGSHHGETGVAENDGELYGGAAEPAGAGGLF